MHFSTGIALVTLASINQLVAAQNCGPNLGKCAAGLCCSQFGFCGDTNDHCALGKCQPEFSDSCQGGAPTPPANLPRPALGTVPYGQIIKTCTTPGVVALTFDDGPWTYTAQLLDILAAAKAPATFFIAGANFPGKAVGDASQPWPNLIRRMNLEGHQIAHHTWNHPSLNNVSTTMQATELMLLENAYLDILGFYPTYFRCPYLECNEASGALGTLKSYGYHVIDTNADTKDYLSNTPETIQAAKDKFANDISAGTPASNSFITLSHDSLQQTVVSLAQFMIDTARAKGYKLVTVGECLGDPKANWYRGRDGNAYDGAAPAPVPTTLVTVTGTAPASSPTAITVSTDGTCGAAKGKTCKGSTFGDCCSQWGFCGSTADYCAAGCNSGFGDCNSAAAPSATSAATSSPTTLVTAASPVVPVRNVASAAAPSSC